MLLNVPIKPNDSGFKELIDALEKCPSITEPKKRRDIIGFLDDIGKQVEERDTVRASVISILKALSGFPSRFDELIDAIGFYDQDNEYFNNLIEVVSDIATQQQDLENKSNKVISLFENFELNNSDETFESLWSDLCSILDRIDWENIWHACIKIKEINKSEYKKNYIKSLCFTKNYESLKQIFLDQYDHTLIIKLGEFLKKDNKNIKSWLDKANCEFKNTRTSPDLSIDENRYCFPPILLIIIDRLGDGKDQDKWNVRGQFKTQEQQSELLLSQDKQGITCDTFEAIPEKIKLYLDFLENDFRFSGENIGKLRVEVFLSLSEIRRNIDDWTVDSEEGFSTPLITKHRIFIRIKERISKRRNYRINLLKQGWEKIDGFLKQELAISKASFGEIRKKTGKCNLIEILEETNVSNWIELTDFMEHCLSLWCMSWKKTLPNDESERMNFFGSILDSGIPITFWNWDSIPQEVEQEVKLETKFAECLCRSNLVNRCQKLLETTWSLRRVAWGEKDKIERQKRPGYYLGMLLEDPEILPEENPLQTIGVNK